MLKQPFIRLAPPRLEYKPFAATPREMTDLPTTGRIMLLHPGRYHRTDSVQIAVGDTVKTGQKLALFAGSDDYVISPVTGTVAGIDPFSGDFGRNYAAVSIDVAETEDVDGAFADAVAAPALDVVDGFLRGMPGMPDVRPFMEPDKPIEMILVSAADPDLMVDTREFVVRTRTPDVKRGIQMLRELTGVERVVVALPSDILQGIGSLGTEIFGVDPSYPSAIPRLVANAILGSPIPADRRLEEAGVAVWSVEAVAALGSAFDTGRIPHTKVVTLIRKDGTKSLVGVRIGTPVGAVLRAFGESLGERDRLILGGPMTGSAVYTETAPVQADTDAILVQDKDAVPYVSDYPCINCGECNRVCPTSIQVNMLVRFLEADQYEDAADLYDLYSCVECGLCSFVCVSQIPIFQYIRLAKYELGRVQVAEGENV